MHCMLCVQVCTDWTYFVQYMTSLYRTTSQPPWGHQVYVGRTRQGQSRGIDWLAGCSDDMVLVLNHKVNLHQLLAHLPCLGQG